MNLKLLTKETLEALLNSAKPTKWFFIKIKTDSQKYIWLNFKKLLVNKL